MSFNCMLSESMNGYYDSALPKRLKRPHIVLLKGTQIISIHGNEELILIAIISA